MTSGDVALDLSALYDEAPCGWFTMRLDGTVVRANRTLFSMLGRDLVGARLSQVLSAGGRIFLETHCLPLLKMARRVDSVALDLMTSTGQSVPVLLSAVFADGANGPLVHATVVDASDRRSYERELLAATRAAEQATQRLQEAQSELERSALHDSQAAAWNIQRRLDVAVNLSAPEISDPTLPDRVLRACQDFGLSPDRLTLEVTETALLVDTDVAFRNARSLRDAGVRLALDDFGTGYSGFTYLKRVPVDELKIDRSFVSGVASEPSDRAIVRGTIALAHELRLNVVAEGVETAEQDAALAMMGCDLAQGYLYLRPVSADDLAAFLPSSPDAHTGRSTSVA